MSITFAIGDIHGSLHKLDDLLARCAQLAGERPATFVFLGDYIDRGPDSAGVICRVMDLQSRLPDHVIALKGNHEALLLDVMDDEARLNLWLSQGGVETLRSYGGDIPDDHIDWLRSLAASYDDGLRFFVHAGVDPQTPLPEQSERELLWIREPFLSDTRDYGRLIVHGHTPQPSGRPDLRENRLNIDTGAVYGGPLTAAVFSASARAPFAFLQSS
jgi:serine/threonine protein phosphatase 1